MKIWLPDSLYRTKPFLLALFGAALLYVSNDLFSTGLALASLGYASWIIVIRLLWSTTGMIKTKADSSLPGEPKTHYVNMSRKK